MLLLGITKNHCEVYVDMEASHAATHFANSPKLYDAVVTAIPQITVDGNEARFDFDTGELVGMSDLVETNSDDEIVYALRVGRDRYSRFVKNKTAVPSTFITLAFELLADNKYRIHTAFIGRLTPSFPGGDYRPEESLDFWSKYALVWGNQQVIPETETTACPW